MVNVVVEDGEVVGPSVTIPRLGGTVIAAVAAVWVIWGSTYLGIKVGLETMPPFFMQGCRFVVASLVMYAFLRSRGAEMPSWRQARNAAGIGLLLLIGGLGMVTLAEDRGIGSGLVATLIAIQPMLASVWGGLWGTWPGRRVWVGMSVGMVGVGVLMADSGLVGSWSGIALVLVACCSWSFGSTLSRQIDMPSGAMATTCEMAAAAVAFMFLTVISGERVHMPSLRSGLALAYLIVFGSIVAFTAFTYLLSHVPASLAMSYAYVNPAIAVLLGTVLADEVLSVNMAVALPIILVGVALVTTSSRSKAADTTEATEAPTTEGSVPGRAHLGSRLITRD